YNVRPLSDPPSPLHRNLEEGEYQGRLPETEGYLARAKVAVRSMVPMRFPRYLNRDPRDFFYLTARPILPGPDLVGQSTGGQHRFRTAGLPNPGFPPAFARLESRGELGTRGRLVGVGPKI